MESCGIRPHLNLDYDAAQKYFDVTIFDRRVFTTLTTDPEFVDSWIRKIIFPEFDGTSQQRKSPPPVQGLIIGVDIQLVGPGLPPATIQLCINGQCLIYHMHDAFSLPFDLQLLLTHPGNSLFGVGLHNKLPALQYYSGFTHKMPIRNLSYLAAVRQNRPELLHAGISELASTVLRKQLVIPQVDPDWNRPELLDEQVMHACIGAFVSYELAKVCYWQIQVASSS